MSTIGQTIDLHSILQAVGGTQFDLVLMAGVLYHVFDPLYAISTARQLTRHHGLALVETHFLRDEQRPVMMFNPVDPDGIEGATNFFWRASMSCLEGMFHVCGFRVISRISVGKRITYLVRAVRPSELTEASPLTRSIHASFMSYKHYRENINYRALEQARDASKIRLLRTPRGDRRLSVKTYKPKMPFQPAWSAHA